MKPILSIFFILIVFASAAQDSTFKLVDSIQSDYVDFTVDNLGNYYLLTTNNQLKKLNANRDSMGMFNDVRRYGKLFSIDASNPLKVLLYYKNYSTVVVLDRFLNVLNTIDFRKQNIFQVKAIAQSYDNQLWLYDEQDSKLKKIGDDGKVLFETVDFRIIFDEVPSPTQIFDQDGFVYLYDPEKGIYVFDIYGSFKTKISYLGLSSLSIFGKTIVGIDNQQLFAYTSGTLTDQRIHLPYSIAQRQKVVITPGHLYVLKNGTVLHFTF